jgi:hypothetical protein
MSLLPFTSHLAWNLSLCRITHLKPDSQRNERTSCSPSLAALAATATGSVVGRGARFLIGRGARFPASTQKKQTISPAAEDMPHSGRW